MTEARVIAQRRRASHAPHPHSPGKVSKEVAGIFDRMARLLTFKGADRFRALAYDRAATSLRALEGDLAVMAREGRLEEIPGIGPDLSAMIEEYIETGRIRRYERERRGTPEGLLEMMDIPGLGPKTLALLHKRFHIKNIEDLRRLVESGALLKLRGFGEKKVGNLRRGLELWRAGRQRRLLGVALPLAEHLLADVRKIRTVERAELAGSIRRRAETVGDIDLLITSRDAPRALYDVVQLPAVTEVIAEGDTRVTLMIEGGTQVDVRAVARESWGAALQYFTGSKRHGVHLRTIAHERGLKLNEYGVFRGEKRLGGKDEAEVYGLLGLTAMPPELREDRGEIEAALEGRLPKLIEVDDLRGDLHMHTTYSDGRSTIEEMIEGAARLGHEYIALTDHSPSSRIANGLDLGRLEEKISELEAVRKKRGSRNPRVLLGAEVDILPDGSLDYPDEILARLDVVVASLHSAFRQSRDRMTGRLLDAISNPYVHVIGHPTTRLIGSRDPVEFDFERVIEAAAEAGVALEVNGSPSRLDLSDTMARAAQEAGALLAIDSDAHSAAQLEQIGYGVAEARRGWVEAPVVVNTWPWAKFSGWLRSRREH
ncbi:MAG TPA: DNA polymerase/3'-5' exonuclease PolX [Blastocatellia bacterium]|nr:DNA polymerase/3'-5' exonuclease PolX [Blastocatellia bacterium]